MTLYLVMFFKKEKDPLACLDTTPRISDESNFIVRALRTLISYTLLTGWVFVVLLLGVNFSAYSQVLINYLNPSQAEQSGQEIVHLLDSVNFQVYAGDSVSGSIDPAEKQLIHEAQLERATEAVKEVDPKIANDTSYSPIRLAHGIDTEQSEVSFALVPYDNRIIIPKIGKNIPLVDVRIDAGFDLDHMENIFMQELEKWVVRYPGTAVPGQAGNAFIFGHSSNYPWIKWQYNEVFALLNKLEPGDEIIVYYNQRKYVYVVQDYAVVKPGDVKALQSRDPNKKELSLMTCWPIGTNINRLIVFAELQE